MIIYLVTTVATTVVITVVTTVVITVVTTVQTQEYTCFPGKTAPLHTLHPRNPNRGIPRKETQPERDFLTGELQLIQPKG
jgi:hypothetical protein